MTELLFSIVSQKRFLVTTLMVFTAYVLIYLAAVGQLVFTSRMEPPQSLFVLHILPNWQELLFRQRSPFLFEPIGALYLGPNLTLFLSIPNILLSIMLGTLVGTNIALSYYSARQLGLSGRRGVLNLLGTIPAIISGAACCVPTLILVTGLQLTATLATTWSFFVPLSVALLFVSLMWSLKRIQSRKIFGL